MFLVTLALVMKERINWIDLSKGFAILFMVIGHTNIPESLSKYIWSFHMPLFFFVSGIFLYKSIESNVRLFLTKKVNSLLLPYFFFSFIVFCGYYGTEYHRPYEIYMGWEGYALWFIPVLFLSELFIFCIVRLLRKYKIPENGLFIIVPILLYVISVSLSCFDIKLPYKIDCVPLCSIFVLYGYYFSRVKDKIKFNFALLIVSFCVSIVLSQILPKTGLGRNCIGYGIPNIVNAFLGIYTFFCISILMERIHYTNNFILWCGRNSIFIMAFSQLYNYWIFTILGELNSPKIVVLPIRYILLFVFIYISAITLTKYLPFLVGRKK